MFNVICSISLLQKLIYSSWTFVQLLDFQTTKITLGNRKIMNIILWWKFGLSTKTAYGPSGSRLQRKTVSIQNRMHIPARRTDIFYKLQVTIWLVFSKKKIHRTYRFTWTTYWTCRRFLSWRLNTKYKTLFWSITILSTRLKGISLEILCLYFYLFYNFFFLRFYPREKNVLIEVMRLSNHFSNTRVDATSVFSDHTTTRRMGSFQNVFFGFL